MWWDCVLTAARVREWKIEHSSSWSPQGRKGLWWGDGIGTSLGRGLCISHTSPGFWVFTILWWCFSDLNICLTSCFYYAKKKIPPYSLLEKASYKLFLSLALVPLLLWSGNSWRHGKTTVKFHLISIRMAVNQKKHVKSQTKKLTLWGHLSGSVGKASDSWFQLRSWSHSSWVRALWFYTDNVEPAWKSLCSPHPHGLSAPSPLSKQINKHLKRKKYNVILGMFSRVPKSLLKVPCQMSLGDPVYYCISSNLRLYQQ